MRAFGPVVGGILVSGVLFAWALPPTSLWMLGWLALAPLFAAVHRRGFLVGFVAGLACLFVTAKVIEAGWLPGVLRASGDSAWLYTGCGFYAFVVSSLSGLVGEWKRLDTKRIVLLASLGVLLEAVMLWVLPAHIALTQWNVPAMLWVASWTGIWGVSWLLWVSNAFLACALVDRSVPNGLLLAVGAIGLAIWLSMPEPLVGGGPRRQIMLVQSPSTDETDLRAWQARASEPGQGVYLSVWPEFAGMMAAPRGDTTELREIVAQGPAVVTSFEDDARPLPHNAAALFETGNESERYFKRKPFGGEKNMHAAGDRPVAVPFRGGKLGLAVCFDSCYPAVMRDVAKIDGVGMIALPTIDPESPQAFIAAVHAAFTPFRAAELGVPIARADGHAYSTLVNSRGRTRVLLCPGEQLQTVQAGMGSRWTFYKAVGDWFLWLCGAMALVGIVGSMMAKARQPQDQPDEPLNAETGAV